MKKLSLLGLIIVFFAVNAFANEPYKITKNAAIKGHNTETLSGVSPYECISTCDIRSWCKSFDYYKGKNKCDLSNKSKEEVGLKTTYPNNPYDHYEKPLKTTPPKYIYTPNAAIQGHNTMTLKRVSVLDCQNSCNDKSWCKSFDYYKGKNKCDLSDKNKNDIPGGLKKDYSGHPYDHYQKR